METIHPKIIQGGMGVNISNWILARTVSMLGQQGTLSGVMLERTFVNLLQRGDPDGNIRRALAHFPFPNLAEKVWNKFFVEDGISEGVPMKGFPVFVVKPPDLLVALVICANFAFVWLSKEGHDNPVSINYLEKVAMPHPYAITGAILAGVDRITMGAGIPLHVPQLINSIYEWKVATYPVPVVGKDNTKWNYAMSLDLPNFLGKRPNGLKKPGFIPIVSTSKLASVLAQKLKGSIHGFVVEEPTAGGHNAPPREPVLNENGEPLPVYGPKDYADFRQMVDLGLPFWVGGSYANPDGLARALSLGAQGIQAGSIFALCQNSGMRLDIRREMRKHGFNGTLEIQTDMRISPTSYPFKKALLSGTISEEAVYNARTRICDIGGLVYLYGKENGSIGYRCPAEPVDKYVKKGGDIKDTVGRGCLCNGLFATAGMNTEDEPPVVTIGDDLSFLKKVMANKNSSYGAKDAINYLLGIV